MAWSSAGLYNNILVDLSTGQPLPNQTFVVYEADGTTEATIYTDTNLTGLVPQPLKTDDSANAKFWVLPGYYVLSSGATTEEIQVDPNPLELDVLNQTAKLTSDNDFGGHVLTNYATAGITETSTAWNLDRSLYPPGSRIYANNSSPITVTLVAANPDEEWEIMQVGAGQITFAHGAFTLVNDHGHTKTYGQGSRVSVVCTSTTSFSLQGATAA